MTVNKDVYIEYLEHHINGPLPEAIKHCDAQQLRLHKDLVERVLEKEQAGLDKFFDSASQILKYLPNFIAVAITNKYIEPPIAARITPKLELKHSISIAKSLAASYVCEMVTYLEDQYATEFLQALAQKQRLEVVEQLYNLYPLRLLDMLYYDSGPLQQLLPPPSAFWAIKAAELSEHRARVYQKLWAIYRSS